MKEILVQRYQEPLTEKIGLAVSGSLKERLQERAEKDSRSLSNYVRIMLERILYENV